MTAATVVVTESRHSVVITDSSGSSVVVAPPAAVNVVISTPGPAGPPGPGVPIGGATGDLLTKASGTNYDTTWTATPTVDALQFDLTAAVAAAQGQLAWNADEQTLDLGKGGGVTLQIGQEQLSLCRNSTASTIPNGTAVMFAGTLGNSGRLLVAPMVADGTYPGYVFFGITTSAIAPGADGFVTTFGKVRGVNTSSYTEGAVLWCNPAIPGGLTATEPQAPNLKLPVAAVISAKNNGILMVRADTGRRLQDLHDVEANGGKSDGEVLTWVEANNRWEPVAAGSAVILQSAQVIGRDYTLSAGENGISVGPVQVSSGYTVTVPAGAVWLIA